MNNMGNLNQKTLAVTVTAAAVLGLGAAGTAHAGSMAFSSLIIDDFIVRDDTGNQLDLSDFATISISDTGDNSAAYNSSTGINATAERAAEVDGGPTDDTVLGVADAALTCQGPNCGGIGQNDFTQQSIPPLQQFARSDTLLEGAVITGGGATDVNGNPLNFARASQVAEVQVGADTGFGSSDASVSDITTFDFSLTDPTSLTFLFNARSAFHLLMQQPDVSALANRAFAISLTNVDTGALLFSWAPNGVSNGAAGVGGDPTAAEISDPFNLNFTDGLTDTGQVGSGGPVNNTGFFQALTGQLPVNQTIRFSVASSVGASANVSAVTVPEPATLALLSAGLLGMGAASRRRKS